MYVIKFGLLYLGHDDTLVTNQRDAARFATAQAADDALALYRARRVRIRPRS